MFKVGDRLGGRGKHNGRVIRIREVLDDTYGYQVVKGGKAKGRQGYLRKNLVEATYRKLN